MATGTTKRCGAGMVNTWAGEACDDGEQNGTPNHCNKQCKGTTPTVCGNGVTEEGEVCDDDKNNGTPNHCSRTCQAITRPVCGNGNIEEGEECDAGQETATCNHSCTAVPCATGTVNHWAGDAGDYGVSNGTVGP